MKHVLKIEVEVEAKDVKYLERLQQAMNRMVSSPLVRATPGLKKFVAAFQTAIESIKKAKESIS